ncbi:sugar transporter [Filimonas lacunae]|nr:sugar transporter [Filimonas lacunae]
MTPIYAYLGAQPEQIPLLNLAGPMTGLLVQPIIGAMSDKTISRFGRRRPYFMIGAICCSLCLLAMPFSSSLWMAAGLLWMLDAANNMTMEPYRAFVSDQLPVQQHATGFLSQSFFTGLGITLANLTPSLLVSLGWIRLNARSSNHIPYTTYAAFLIGAAVSIGSVFYSVLTTREYPLTAEEEAAIRQQPSGVRAVFTAIFSAIRHMPVVMRRLALVYLFNWYAMFIYWQFITLCLARTIYHTSDPASEGFSAAQLLTGKVNGMYNIVTFCTAFGLAWLSARIQAKRVHAFSLLLAGAGLLLLPFIQQPGWLILSMAGLGIGWASMMGTPYVILAGQIPPQQTGVYMGILNMCIVLPMLLETVSFRYVYHHMLQASPERAIQLAGGLLLVSALLTLRISILKTKEK